MTERDDDEGCATAWLSHGLEKLIADKDAGSGSREGVDFDVVVVGSGYGGAVAAAELAGRTNARGEPLVVCVLERGREYLPGMFPQRMADLAQHVRFSTTVRPHPRGEREGLFDVRVGPDVCAVVASGVGGGSLINAGVMEAPRPNVFAKATTASPREGGWPANVTFEALAPYFDEARRRLGASVDGKHGEERNTIALHSHGPTDKYRALEQLARKRPRAFAAAAITVTMRERTNGAGVTLRACELCGDCATGCNHQAKESLDVNLLAEAARAGAHIYTGATVLRLERTKKIEQGNGKAGYDVACEAGSGDDEAVWTLVVVHTDERLRARQGPPFRITASKVVLAAGTFGSTEILMRSETDKLKFSGKLGQRFSTNGDMIAVAYDQKIEIDRRRRDVNAAADENEPPERRHVGPTITGIVDLRERGGDDVVIEELAVPGPLARLFEETVATGRLLQELAVADTTTHDPASADHDPLAVDRGKLRRSSIVALMGDDGADGALELVGGDDEGHGDGAIRVRWPAIHEHALFATQMKLLRELGEEAGTGGHVVPNPLWQLLPDQMQMLLDNKRGPLLTVHPLGGCPMADSAKDGVVDEFGRVFDGSERPPTPELPGLVVLDGSIVPVALRINPSLTIAALALRAIRHLRDDADKWRFRPPQRQHEPLPARPVFCAPAVPHKPRPTEVEFVERMTGPATLAGKGGGAVRCVVELTLRFAPLPLETLIVAPADSGVPLKRTLHVRDGRLRIYDKAKWDAWRDRGGGEDELPGIAGFAAPVSGELDFLHREASTAKERRCRGLRAWFFNRGLRDSVQELLRDLDDPTQRPEHAGEYLRSRWEDLQALATRAGEVRLFEYRLRVSGKPEKVDANATFDVGVFERRHEIAGRKRFTYDRRANPWRQLSEMTLETFPGLIDADGSPLLQLDTTYLAEQRIALMRFVGQQDEPSALVDLASFGAYFVRLMLSVHVWSFRRPDAAAPREPQRLPGIVPGLPDPEIRELDVATMQDGRPVRVRLTRYPRRDWARPPLVMIHGYSASGTTFAHPAVDPNLAKYCWDRGRDVWILDLRTSSGMPTARYPWAFEEVALADLPAAFDYIYRATECARRNTGIDVFAHCMGAAMFSMVLLASPASGEPYFRERRDFPDMIRRVVLSQIGPVVVFSPANVFRAYLLSYIRSFLPLANYEFRVGPDPTLTDQLIDRFLAALPYPKEEFDLENPFWTPWRRTPFVGTRHRMDALYGRDFSLANIRRKTLDAIDDLFGPLSIDTVAQAINFARLEVITSRAGRNEFVSRENLLRRWKRVAATLSIHGRDNGLADVATLARMKALLADDLALDFRTHAFAGFGHQDSLIGRNAGDVFAVVQQFFDEEEAA